MDPRNSRIRHARDRLAKMIALALAVSGLFVFGPAGPARAAVNIGPNINVSKGVGNQAEGTIAVDPTSPNRVAAVSNQGDGAPTGLMAAYSTDSGATWTHRIIADGSGGLPSACCDPSMSWDSFGNLFLVYLDSNTTSGSVHVLLSTDGGQNYTAIADLAPNSGDDQPSVTTGAGSVWVDWTGPGDVIEASGAKVSGAGAAGVGAFSAPEKAGQGDFGDLAISPTGAVMVTYQRPQGGAGPSALYEEVDGDGLGTGGFGAESTLATLTMGGFTPIPAQSTRDVDSEVGLAWDRSGGPHNGRLYAMYSDSPSTGSNDLNIFVKYSEDSGAHWTSPIRVNDDTGTNSQFLPKIALDQDTGKIAVAWHDARNSAGDNTAQLFAATSDDGASFSSNFQVSVGTSNASPAHNGIDYGDYIGLAYQSGDIHPFWADNSNSTGDNPNGTLHAFNMYTSLVTIQTSTASNLVYTGATTSDYHDAFTASATLTAAGSPVSGAAVTFTLGGQSCTGTTNGSGIAACTITPQDPAGTTTISASYAGGGSILPSTASVPFTITKEETSLVYTGPPKIANGTPVTLSGVLTEDGTVPIAGRSVSFALGTGATQQTCSGTTDSAGKAACTIASVNQPLNNAATVPLAVSFGGDAFYKPSAASAALRLEYYTGHAYGLSAQIDLLVTGLTIPPSPDTGAIRTAQATSTTTPCAASINTLLITADALCPKVVTTLAPGTSTATSTVKNVTIGIPGLPVIAADNLTSTSVSTCKAATGTSTLTLTIAGVPVTIPSTPNYTIDLGAAKLVVNEQKPVPGADFGLTVDTLHLTSLDGLIDVVVGSSTSDAHNCS